MNEHITVIGNVATDPKQGVTGSGVPYVSLRVASDARRLDATTGAWVDGDPNWYTVNAYRALAENIYGSVRVGDRVVVHGRLRIRPWTDGERKGTAVEIAADAFGPDLRWGTATFRRAKKDWPTDPDLDVERTSDAADVSVSQAETQGERDHDAEVPVPF